MIVRHAGVHFHHPGKLSAVAVLILGSLFAARSFGQEHRAPPAEVASHQPAPRDERRALEHAAGTVEPKLSAWDRVVETFFGGPIPMVVIERGLEVWEAAPLGDLWVVSARTRKMHALTHGLKLRSPVQHDGQRIAGLSSEGLVELAYAPGQASAKLSADRKLPIPAASVVRLLKYADSALLALTADQCLVRLDVVNLAVTDKVCSSKEGTSARSRRAGQLAELQHRARSCGERQVFERREGVDPVRRIDIALRSGRTSENLTRDGGMRRNVDPAFTGDCSELLFVGTTHLDP